MKDRVKAVLGQVFGIPAQNVADDISMDTLEAWDSVKHLSLILALEQEFGLQFPEKAINEMLSFPLILAAVKEHGGK